MITVSGWVQLSPGGAERLRDVSERMIAATRQETGCIDYAFAIDLLHADTIRIAEIWSDQAALDAHFATRHMAEFNAALAAESFIAADIKAYESEETRVLISK